MLKKAGYITLSMLLFLSTTGFSISSHYCHGKLASSSFFVEKDSCCSTNDSNSCCKDKTEIFQLDEEYSISSLLELYKIVPLNLWGGLVEIFNPQVLVDKFVTTESPPPLKIQIALAKRQTYLL